MNLAMLPRELPVFLCEETRYGDNRQWKFWCPYCRRDHRHSPQAGVRTANCDENSPLKKKGYILIRKGGERFVKDDDEESAA
jgi:hypothetical protein